MAVLLLPGTATPSFDAEVIRRLGCFGVTRLVLVGDERSFGIVLEGWAFDPARSGGDAAMAVAGEHVMPALLLPVMETALSTIDPSRP